MPFASEAIRSYIIERYTTDSLVNFLRYNKLENKSRRWPLHFAENRGRAAKADFVAASAAGLDSESKAHRGLRIELEFQLHRRVVAGTQPLAVQTSHTATKTPVTSIPFLRDGPCRHHEGPSSVIIFSTPQMHTQVTSYLFCWFNQSARPSFDLSGAVGGTNPESLHKVRDFGIIPTASVAASHLPWRNGWHGSGGWEYRFPRFQGLHNMESGRPLIILGGGREFSGGNLEIGESDDGAVNARKARWRAPWRWNG